MIGLGIFVVYYSVRGEEMNFEKVKEILPQSIPFIMIDKVVELEPNERITCLKNITGNEMIFLGHFPNKSIFPGAYITEALAQASIILFHEKKQENTLFLLSSTKLRFKHPVVPGDQLILNITTKKNSSIGAIVEAEALVEDKVVVQGELSFSIKQQEEIM